jgi:hypothetical protein
MNEYGMQLTIEVVKGGFILQYPTQVPNASQEEWVTAREVFVSPRKLNQKVKEVIESVSLVKDE